MNNDDNNEYQIDLNDTNSILELQNLLNEFQNSVLNIQPHPDNNRYVIEFEFDIEDNTINDDIIEDNIPNYFKSMQEINTILGKSVYIKECDDIIDKECLICLEKFKYKKYKRIVKCCANTYHKTCIDKWLKKNSSCPACRHDFLEKKEEKD